MIDDLNDLRLFTRIALHGSITAAARDMGLAINVASKRLAALERRLGVSLLLRTTRRSTLTEEGLLLLERARGILDEVDEIEARFAERHHEPRGLLRIGAPAALGRRVIAPLCAELMTRWPGLRLDLLLSDRISLLVDESLDVVIRIGAMADSSLMIRKLTDSRRIIAASPAYLERCGIPTTPEAIAGHEVLRFGNLKSWDLAGPHGRKIKLCPDGRLYTDSGDVAHDWARLGLGLVFKSEIDIAQDLADGTLVRVLPDWEGEPAPVSAIYPAGRHVPHRLRVFLDRVIERLRTGSATK
ncbi:LysR family transcriptional regulator [Asaia krungthepensis]|uniref:Transcriptional regulator n=1 Tax=Asaia krungthepensis NRIC 0535 TaxID=1307925 RepID=A0ABQ0Q4V0_9PROT|nr:LysR family transcriptional regulator [Asaia krungthepensis]GBQ91473.1 transcriptional regulator [Asaia krungthepensis NRIC 0535]